MMQDDMIINTEDKELTIEHLYTVEDYFTFNIRVKSGDFSGVSNFCISKKMVHSIVEKLTEMHKELKGFCEIVDNDSDAYITFSMDKHGHMSVYGQIGGSHEEHFMKFKYSTDQTVLEKVIKLFKGLL
ncbi:hypothetical protein SPSYN_02691 [Sporotomaculum syntrophicum]|uniref:Uncharacterized protein n=1 Tax=Sporotomaculum syntrophicum TaxID=182264 RepID=A0A9D2WMN6_9FIRM|nr:hypothetical protein [Sporotomaculum syntrophicum]KAF1084287.1 hypothetical protein SPSYN_02691 [Sporotomaculum syntrophicum]